jgi:hypothetical protein
MWSKFKFSNAKAMSPTERAFVLGAIVALTASIMFLFDGDTGPEKTRAWEVPLVVAGAIGLGWLSAFSLWTRVLSAGVVLAAIHVGIEVAASRPHSLDAGFIVSSILHNMLCGAASGALDLPIAFRSWARTAISTSSRLFKWAMYYVATALVWLTLIVAVDALCDALVANVLPSAKFATTTQPVISVISSVLTAGLLGVLLVPRWLASATRPVWLLGPALVVVVGVLMITLIAAVADFVVANSGAPLLSAVHQKDLMESAQLWRTAPLRAILEQLQFAAVWSALLIPVAIGLEAWAAHVNAKGGHSKLVRAALAATLICFCSFIGMALGQIFGVIFGGSSGFVFGSHIGEVVGLIAAVLIGWIWLKRHRASNAVPPIAARYVSGEGTLPEQVAQAVEASRRTYPNA